jgi:hypothetical protein
MDTVTDLRMLQALLCTLVVRAGGTLRLPAAEVAACGNAYRLCPEADRDGAAVLLTVRGAAPAVRTSSEDGAGRAGTAPAPARPRRRAPGEKHRGAERRGRARF